MTASHISLCVFSGSLRDTVILKTKTKKEKWEGGMRGCKDKSLWSLAESSSVTLTFTQEETQMSLVRFVWDLTRSKTSFSYCGLPSLVYLLSDAGPEDAKHIPVKTLSQVTWLLSGHLLPKLPLQMNYSSGWPQVNKHSPTPWMSRTSESWRGSFSFILMRLLL